MTNEDIIKGLTLMRKNFDTNSVYGSYCIDCLDAAIEALKEQPEHSQNTPQKQPDLETLGVKTGKTCADAISRQDAIEELSYLQTYLFDSRDHDNKVSLEDVRYAIEQLPSAQPEQRWIPVSERMPEVGKDVMVCYDFKGHRSVLIGVLYGDEKFHGYDDEYLTPEGHKYRKAVAWMPLPEPWRGDSICK